MMDSVDRLVSIATAPLGERLAGAHQVPRLLAPLIHARNGFFALESALLVRPWGTGSGSCEWWNGETAWCIEYGDAVAGMTFFAEDVFGFQFGVSEDGFFTFDPETSEIEAIAPDVQGWAAYILENYEEATGYPIAHAWQVANGPLAQGTRLAPAVPFVLGGSFEVDELRAKTDLELARFRADVFGQIKDLPDGATVELKLVNDQAE